MQFPWISIYVSCTTFKTDKKSPNSDKHVKSKLKFIICLFCADWKEIMGTLLYFIGDLFYSGDPKTCCKNFDKILR